MEGDLEMLRRVWKLQSMLWFMKLHDKYNDHCCVLYMKVVERVKANSSHYKEETDFSILIILCLCEMMDVH